MTILVTTIIKVVTINQTYVTICFLSFGISFFNNKHGVVPINIDGLKNPKKKNNSQKNFHVKYVVIDVTINIIIILIFLFFI